MKQKNFKFYISNAAVTLELCKVDPYCYEQI